MKNKVFIILSVASRLLKEFLFRNQERDVKVEFTFIQSECASTKIENKNITQGGGSACKRGKRCFYWPFRVYLWATATFLLSHNSTFHTPREMGFVSLRRFALWQPPGSNNIQMFWNIFLGEKWERINFDWHFSWSGGDNLPMFIASCTGTIGSHKPIFYARMWGRVERKDSNFILELSKQRRRIFFEPFKRKFQP